MQWFENWFDTEYYHLLYGNHDVDEAESFIGKILDRLQPDKADKILDLACGKGRLARSLASRGHLVIGIDLSLNSINEAKKYETERMKFYRHNMLEVFRRDYFDLVFNFFTSFGYFDSDEEHLQALKAVHENLRSNGCFVLDYLNSEFIAEHLIDENEIVKDGVKFKMQRKVEAGYFVKDITVFDGDVVKSFTERVRAFDFNDISLLLEDAGFSISDTFGNYQLDEYRPDVSPRLIVVARKID